MVELLHIPRTREDLHNTPVLIDHAVTGLQQPLAVNEKLVVSDIAGNFFEGLVLMRIGEPLSPRYFLHVGAELTVGEVTASLKGASRGRRAAYQDYDLLDDLRRGLTRLGA